jgi:arsenite methyltransferase
MQQRPDYGIDSPAMVAGELILSGVGFAAAAILYARRAPRPFGIPLWAVSLAVAAYLLLMAGGMLFYSVIGKRAIRDWLLDQVPWRGDEVVLDVGCGRGLLLVGAARRLTSGKAIGVDAWIRGAVSGNRPAAALRNARLAGVAERVTVRDGDARRLPCADASVDVVVCNFVLHEMDTRTDRELMLSEIARVLRPGGHVALVDFIFTGEAVRLLRAGGVGDARRTRAGWVSFWSFALVTLGLGQLYLVTGSKAPAMPALPRYPALPLHDTLSVPNPPS